MLLPTTQIPETDDKSEEELKDILAIYIMQFGRLNYNIALKALNNISYDDEKIKSLKSAPIPTIARETVKLTEFTTEEREKYKRNQEIIYSVDNWNCKMLACNRLTYKRVPEKDRPFTALEEDYYKNHLMRREEYWYWKDKEQGIVSDKPPHMTYNPKTRKNDLFEELALSDFVPMEEGK